METLNEWADVLKRLRETDQAVLLSVISNLDVTFTHDAINIYVGVKSTHDMLKKNIVAFGSDRVKLIYREQKKGTAATVEKKLQNMFGDRFEVKT